MSTALCLVRDLHAVTIVHDTFTESTDTPLTSHIPDIGVGWTEVFDSSADGTNAKITSSTDTVEGGSDQNDVGQAYTAQPAPPSVDQDLSITIKALDTTSGTKPIGLFGRRIDNNNFYHVQILPNTNPRESVKLFKYVAGDTTELGTYDATLAVGTVIKLEIRNATKKVYVDGVERISSTDNELTSAGTWGLHFGDYNGAGTGAHLRQSWDLDDFLAESPGADLEVTKSVDNSAPNEGDTITYTVVLANNGPESATNVDVTDALPAGVTYVSDTTTQGMYTSGTGLWDVGTVTTAANDTLMITATVDPGTGGSMIGNTATVTASDQADGTPGNDTSSVNITVQFVGPLVVDTGADSLDGDTSSRTSLVGNRGSDGRISLREAILAANNSAGPDTIQFAIGLADSGHVYYQDDSVAGTLSQIVHTTLSDASISDFDPDYPGGAAAGYSWYRIQIEGTPLPAITDTLFLDGASQTGFPGKPIVELDGSALGGVGENGFNVSGGASTVRGFVINRFSGSGIEVITAGGNTLTGNHIGTDVTGLFDRGNGAHGIHMLSDAGSNTIGGVTVATRNVISGNSGNGIFLQASSANVVQGNYIGADIGATPNLGNDGHGVLVEGGDNNAIGGTVPEEGNLISGNGTSGVAVRD